MSYVEFAGFRYSIDRGHLFTRQGIEHWPWPNERALLGYLIRYGQDAPIGYDELLEALWQSQGTSVTRGAAEKAVRRLKERLGDAAGDIIRTVHGRGVQFVAQVSGPTPLPVVVVMPFAVRGLPHEAGVVQGTDMADVLTASLAEVLQDRAILRRRVDGSPSARELPRLWADVAIDGLVQVSRSEMIVTVHVRQARGGAPIWARSITVPHENWHEGQNRVCAGVGQALVAHLRKGGAAVKTARNTPAADLCRRAHVLVSRRDPDSLQRAFEIFTDAKTLDSKCAAAYGGLGIVYVLLSSFGTDRFSPRDGMPHAKAAAVAAIDLDPLCASGHPALGAVQLLYEWDASSAELSFRRALESDHRFETALHWYANLLAAQGRFDEARTEVVRAWHVNPSAVITRAAEAWIAYFARRYDDAVAICEEALELEDRALHAHIFKAMALKARGDVDLALKEMHIAVEMAPGSPAVLAELAHTYATADNHQTALSIAEDLRHLRGRYVASYHFAKIAAGLRDTDLALQCLRGAQEERSGWLIHLGVEPMLDGLRGHKEFRELELQVSLSASRGNV